jgi:hypothetical protein
MLESLGYTDVERGNPVAGMGQLSEETRDGTWRKDGSGQGKNRLVQFERDRIVDVDEISQDHIEPTRCPGEKGKNVFYLDLNARIVEAPAVEIRQVLTAGLDYHAVDLDENHFFHPGIAQNLAES